MVSEPYKAKMMIILDVPSMYDDSTGNALSGTRDILLHKYMEMLGATPEDYYVTYMAKCHTDTSAKTSVYHPCIKEYLREELAIVQPNVIVTLGELAMNVLTGSGGITKMHGEMLTSTFLVDGVETDFTTIPTFSIGHTAYNDFILEQFVNDLQKAYISSMGIVADVKKTITLACDSIELVDTVISYIHETEVCCFDFETTEIDKTTGIYGDPNFKPTVLSLSFQAGSAYVIPLFHFETPFSPQEIKAILLKLSKEVFCNPAIKKIAHNAKFDMHVWNLLGLPKMRGKIYDTMLMHHLLNENMQHGLKVLVAEAFPDFKGYEDDVKAYKWDKVPLSILIPYAGMDTDMTLRLEAHFESELMRMPELYLIFRNLTNPALKALFAAEANGMRIDRGFLTDNIREAEKAIIEVKQELDNIKQVKKYVLWKNNSLKEIAIENLNSKIAELQIKGDKRSTTAVTKHLEKITNLTTGKEVLYESINFSSPLQLSELLYSARGFNFSKPPTKKGESEGATGVAVLKQLKDTSGFVELLLAYRSLSKTLATYMVGIGNLADEDNLVHTSFLLHGTATGRLSSKEPNMQNIPRGSALKDERVVNAVGSIKKMFIADEGHYLVQLDYSQAELRLAAFFAKEDTMLTAYANGEDLHTLTAMMVNRLTKEEFAALPKEEQKVLRTSAKAGNFGLLYGMGVKGFMDYARNNYGVSYTEQEATNYRNGFFATYKKLLNWHANYKLIAKEKGYVCTLFGRRRRLTNIWSADEFKRAEDERAGINAPVQGTAGEFTILALTLLGLRLPKQVRLVNTVHDSIIFQVPKELLDSVVPILIETCENLPLQQYFNVDLGVVKMKVDVEYSDTNWKELKPY